MRVERVYFAEDKPGSWQAEHDWWRVVTPDDYKPCDNVACLRKVSAASCFCCGGCELANGEYDPDGYHSQTCNERAAERGEFNIYEADALRVSS